MRVVLAAAVLVLLAVVLSTDAAQRLFAPTTIQPQPLAYGQVAAAPVYGGSFTPYLTQLDMTQYVQPVVYEKPAWGWSDVTMLAVGALVGGAVAYQATANKRAVGSADSDLESGTNAMRIACLAVDGSRVPGPGTSFAGRKVAGVKNDFQQYEVCTLGGQEGDIGVLPPLGVFDPLGLIETKDMRRWEIMEIKHGRAAMLAFLHVIHVEAGVRFPGYLSGSAQLKFTDVPSGCFASLEAIPKAGWLQILAVALACETGFAARPFSVTKQTDDRAPGDIGGAGWVRYSDPATKAFKLNVERQNGRAAMIGITGCLVHELLGVDALYPTGGMSGAAPKPLIDAETAFGSGFGDLNFPALSTLVLAIFVLQIQLTARTGEGNPIPNVGAGFNGGRPFNGSKGSGARSAPTKKPVAKKAAPAKKPVAKKPVAKKPVAKKAVAKKPVAKKPAPKKAAGKK
jgi:hypothetical protein